MARLTLSPRSVPLASASSKCNGCGAAEGREEQRQRDKVTSGPASSAFHFLFLLRKGESLSSLSHWTFPSWLLPSRADCLKRSRRTSSRIRQMATARWEWEERGGLASPSPKVKCETAPSAVNQFDTHGVSSNATPGPDDINFALLINIDHFCVIRSEGIGEKPS